MTRAQAAGTIFNRIKAMAQLEFPLLAMLLIGLAVISWQDIRRFRIPDAATLPLVALGLVYSLAIGNGLISGVIGMAVGYTGFVAIELLYRRLRQRTGLGRGDAKLMAVAGSWCGWAGLPMVLLIGSGTALAWVLLISVAKGRAPALRSRVPFGPFLALGIILALYIRG